MFTARLEFQDLSVRDIEVLPDETLAEAAMRQGVPLRFDCLSGECGACLARCPDSARIEQYSASVISAEDSAEGIVATCRTRLTGTASFRFDFPFAPQPSEPAKHRARIALHERLTDTVSRLMLELDGADGFRFQAGQYLRLRPQGLRVARAFSIASAPSDLPSIELLIRHVEDGQVSNWLGEANRTGASVTLMAPLGGFAADDRAQQQVFIGGGTGIAPLLSMIRDQAPKGRRMVLCFGTASAANLILNDELTALAAAVPTLDLRIAVVEGASGTLRAGTVLDLLRTEDFARGTSFHLCGPPAMVDAARARLRAAKVPFRTIRAERFLPSV